MGSWASKAKATAAAPGSRGAQMLSRSGVHAKPACEVGSKLSAVCVNCASQVWQSSASAGGPSGVQALLAAGAASFAARAVGNWLAARGLGWVTQRRITVATALLVMLAVVAVVLGTAERALY